MRKSGKAKPQPSERRGGRYGMVLELEQEDKDRLDKLVDRYQKLLGPTTSSKAFVLRQLIRHANEEKQLPPVRV